jgi:HEAT repeat protein
MVAIGADPADVTPILVPLLTEHNGNPFGAGELLLQISPEEARRQVALFIPQLANDDGSVNSTALSVIHSLAPQAAEAVPALFDVLREHDPKFLWITANTLGRIGPAAAPAVPELVAVLRSGAVDDSLRYQVVRALGRIGPAAKGAVPLILDVISTPGSPAPAHPQVRMTENDISMRTEAIGTLAELGEASPEVLQTLRVQLSSDSEHVRGAAARCVARLAGDSRVILDELEKLLRDDFAQVRAEAALAIGTMTADRRKVVPELSKLLTDENPYVCTAAAIGLEKIGPDANAALSELRAVLDDETNSLPNEHHPQASPATQFPEMRVRIPELRKISLAQTVQRAIAAIESENRRR